MQWECVQRLARGIGMKQIGLELGTTHSTVRTHLHNAYARLHAANAAQAVAVIHAAGWLDPVSASTAAHALEHEDRRVTPAQRLYLDAFDRFLSSGSSEHREEMGHMLGAMFIESGLGLAKAHARPRREASFRRDPLARLARIVTAP